MRILYLNPYLGNHRNALGETARQVVRELRKAGAQVTTFPARDDAASNSDGASLIDWARRVAHSLPTPVTMFLLERFLLTRAVLRSMVWTARIGRQRKRTRPDLVLARSFEYDWSPWIAARMLGCPLILEVHSATYVERQLRGRSRSRLARWADRMLWERADRLWVVSRNLGTTLVLEGVDPARIRTISLGVNTDRFDPRRVDHPGAGVEIAFVGSFHPWHGVATLLDAFASALRHGITARLILIGDGVTRAENQRQAERLGISQYVDFTGWLPLDEVAERLRTVDIGVAPYSEVERFHFDPVKVLEYMAMGLSVIASDQGEVPVMLDAGRCGVLVPPGKVEPLANEVVRLARNPALRRDLGRAARRRVVECYDWNVTIQQVMALCHETIAAGTAPPTRDRRRAESSTSAASGSPGVA